ncbi:MobC family plasmid mobilization relaxosome protein [Kitasatospora sp. NPDC051170]|uniref:MobC family plasmid mobilization relaxosome protein n=1 Tax=Kitasatospora sp. NPDC051170 TaxID=3364056 RepID=UPI00379D67BF
MAEKAQREGAPGQEVGAEVGPDPDELLDVQRDILADVHPSKPTANTVPTADAMPSIPPVQGAQLANRRFTGVKRMERVGPLQFKPDEHPRLQASAAANGYRSLSGFAADVILAFIDGRFFINLPLAEERRQTHIFRTQVLRALNRIGHNVNQVARALNGGYEPPVDVRQTLDELHHLLTQIADALRQPVDQEV